MKAVLSPVAEKQLKKLPKIIQIVVAQKIRTIRDSDAVGNEEKLAGYKDIYRVRLGDYRLVYRKTAKEIYIILIRHRQDVYRLLRQLFG